jgi:signal transduction histidine kinase
VHFSSKVTSAILIFFDKRGDDVSQVLDQIDFPEEFMRDPSYWIRAEQLENWLSQFIDQCKPNDRVELITEIGSKVPELKAWGVLDSVLRMMPRPQEIMNQPERFLSYFISPEPPIENLRRDQNRVEFDLPISTEQYPLTTAFLKAAFASLPGFVGQPAAHCEWEDIHFSLSWSPENEKLLKHEDHLGHRLSPDLMESIIFQLEKNQKDLERRNQELLERNEALTIEHQELQAQVTLKLYQEKMKGLSEFAAVIANDLNQPANSLAHQILRMQDYMVRAQQLITLFLSTQRESPAVKEALRKLNWDQAKETFNSALRDSETSLSLIRRLSSELKKGSQDTLKTLMNNSSSSFSDSKSLFGLTAKTSGSFADKKNKLDIPTQESLNL